MRKEVDIKNRYSSELEDIFSLLPDKFDGVIDNMRRKSLLLLKNYEEYNHFFWLDE